MTYKNTAIYTDGMQQKPLALAEFSQAV